MRKEIELPIKEIVKKYEEGVSPLNLSKEYNVARATILNRLNEYYRKEGREKPKVKYKSKIGPKTIKLPIDEIVKKYEKGISTIDLAKEYHVGETTIRTRIKEYYETIGKDRIKHKTGQKRKELPIEEIIKKYGSGIEIKEIAKEYNVSYSMIRNIVADHYKKNGKERPKVKSKRKQLPIEQIIKEYENSDNVYLSKKYGVSKETIYERIKEYYLENGKDRIKHKTGPKIKELPIEEIIKKYESGIIQKELAKQYSVSTSTIQRNIQKYYKENEIKEPKKLKSEILIVEYLKKGLTIEEIIKTASNRNIIISQDIINDALNKVNEKNITDDNEER